MIDSIFEHFDSPFFLFDKSALLHELNLLKAALQQYWNNYRIGYSVKTNSLPGLAMVLKEEGICAEVVSEDEYNMISQVGFAAGKIISNGPIKREQWVQKLLNDKVLLNVDSHRELEYIARYSLMHPQQNMEVGLRIHLDIEKEFPGQSIAADSESRFGFSKENNELSHAISKLTECPNVRITGLHLHLSTKSRACEIYQWIVSEFASTIKSYHLKDIRYLDIGGGFYGGLPGKPGWNDYMSSIANELALHGFSPQNLTLIIEPGVSLLAGCFSYYARVIDVKNIAGHTYAVCDGSRIHIDPFMHKASYFHEIIRKEPFARELKPLQRLVGFTCLENDRFFELCNAPRLCEGDFIRFDKVGAYTLSLSPLFISYFPPVYMRENDGSLQCIREKWSAREFLQLSKSDIG